MKNSLPKVGKLKRARRVKPSNRDPGLTGAETAAVELAASREVNVDAIADIMPDWVKTLVDMANENAIGMDGTTRPVKSIIADNEVVFAV